VGAVTSATGASTLVEARGDILLALPGGITIADISITRPLAINTLAAAVTTASAGPTEARHVLTSGAEWLSHGALFC
jgi:hypothetical protein